MAYRCWTHVALAAGQLREAEEFYLSLLGLTVTFREAETADGWRTLRGGGWDAAAAAGIEPGLSSLRRDGIVLALEAADAQPGGDGMLSHLGLAVDDADLAELRQRATELGCRIVTDRDSLLVLDDIYGVRWEVSTSAELTSTGARTGRWLDLPA